MRFDGVRFVVFDTANTRALRHNRVYALFEDRDRNLWIGTEDGGLARMRNGAFTVHRTGWPTTRFSPSGRNARATWVGTQDGGLPGG